MMLLRLLAGAACASESVEAQRYGDEIRRHVEAREVIMAAATIASVSVFAWLSYTRMIK